jgi:MoaA/NifB/PqqE/SkfB family radical SAM enzyme
LSFAPLRVRAGRLRLLVLAVADHCDQRCVHCDIWRGNGERPSLTLAERLSVVAEALGAGLGEALLTGGEPLLSPDVWPIAEQLRQGGARLMLATNGMQIERFAHDLTRLFDEIYVSLDGGEPTTHDGLRGVAAFGRLRSGVAALRQCSPRPMLVARSVLHAGNVGEVEGTVAAAAALGFDHVSFLALDASSSAFGGRPDARRDLVPTREQIEGFRQAIARLEGAGKLQDGFVLESGRKLRQIAEHLRASAGERAFVRPECDAPWWSSVVEADGRVRPCFFHEAVGDARQGLLGIRASSKYASALGHIRGANETCQRCVCPKRRASGFLQRLIA